MGPKYGTEKNSWNCLRNGIDLTKNLELDEEIMIRPY